MSDPDTRTERLGRPAPSRELRVRRVAIAVGIFVLAAAAAATIWFVLRQRGQIARQRTDLENLRLERANYCWGVKMDLVRLQNDLKSGDPYRADLKLALGAEPFLQGGVSYCVGELVEDFEGAHSVNDIRVQLDRMAGQLDQATRRTR